MHRHTRLAAAIGALALAFAGSATHGAYADGNSTRGLDPHQIVAGYVYVNDNTAASNTVAGFVRHEDGTLAPLAGSPFAAGGAGAGHIIGSQGALQRSADHRYLLAADAGSNQIAVLRIRPDGTLEQAEGSPVSSGGDSPVSIAVHGNLVYVANSGGQQANYTGFTLNPGGHLTPLPNSTVALPAGTVIGDVLFNGDGTRLVGTRVDTASLPSEIDSFAVGSNGRLIPAPGSPFPAQSVGPFGSEFRPTNPTQLFVSNAHAGAGNGTVSAYTVAADGTLNSISGSPFADNQTAPCWVEISHDGRYLFTVNTAVPSISRFAINNDGTLALIPGAVPFKNPSGLRPFDARLDPIGAYLYVVDAGAGAVSVFAVSGGDLSELPSSPVALPAGATPFGIVTS
jgi:6-phosphogluconolactonase